MSNTCLYCHNSFAAARSTKQYCSDNCRQMAYLSRKEQMAGLTVGKAGSNKVYNVKETVNPIYRDTVKSNHLENDGKYLKSEQGLDGAISLRQLTNRINNLEATIVQQNNLMLTMWTNIKAGLESTQVNVIAELHKGLAKHNASAQSLNGVNYCKPCSTEDVMLIPIVKKNNTQHTDFVQKGENDSTVLEDLLERIDKMDQKIAEQNSVKSQDDIVKPTVDSKQSEDKIVELNNDSKDEYDNDTRIEGLEKQDRDTKILPLQPEVPYQWLNPKLHVLIQKQLDKGDGGNRLKNALRYWQIEDTKNILWVNIRLRCLLDNLVRLSLRSHTNYETLAALTNAFVQLVNSESYNQLPINYPYTNLIAEQVDLLRERIKDYSGRRRNSKVFVWLTLKQKASLIAACTELAANTEKIKFSELSFDPARLDRSFVQRANTIQRE